MPDLLVMRTGRILAPVHLAALLLIVAGLGYPAFSAAQSISFHHLFVDHGLSDEKINALVQDVRGFIWIGTADGLNRYDGYEVKEFRHDAADSTTIAANEVISLLEDGDGYIWVGTSDGGLDRFDPATERFTHFRHDGNKPASLPNDDVNALVQQQDGTLWVGTDDGLARLNAETGGFTIFRHVAEAKTALSDNRTLSLHVDEDDVLWVGTDGGGLNRFDAESETFSTFRLAGDPPGNIISSIAARERGGLWIGTLGGGVRTFDFTSSTFRAVALEGGIAATIITSLHEDEEGSLWIGTAGGGLHKLDANGQQETFQADQRRPDALTQNFVRVIYGDRQGILWAGTYGGLNWFDRARNSFRIYTHENSQPNSLSSNTILSVTKTNDGALWVGTDEGLNRLIDTSGSFERFRPADVPGGGHQYVTALRESRSGQFWLGTREGLLELSRGSGSFRRAPLSLLAISSIQEDRAGQLWVGSLDDGIAVFNPSTGGIVEISHDPSRTSSLSHQTVEAIEITANGAIWVGTAGGLDRLVDEGDAGVFEHFRHDPSNSTSISDASVLSLHSRANGELWIGTESGGLNRFLPQDPTDGFTAFTETNSGLPSNAVRSITEDGSGFLWLSTGRGLARFDPVTESFRVFDSARTPELSSLTDAAFSSNDGSLFFGGEDGLIAFDPSQIGASNSHPPQISLTGVRIRDEQVVAGKDAPLRVAAPVADAIYLDHDHTIVTFEFAALQFSDPARNRYAVMLEGFENAWRDVGLERRAVFTGLDPGRYTLLVKAASADGIWTPEPLSVRVFVAPPWWRTIWAYLAYAALLGGLVVLADRFQLKRLLRQKQVGSGRREAELREEMAKADARMQRVQNETKAAQLERAGELEKAYEALAESRHHLKTMRAQLIEAEKLASLGQLTAGIAHELKNPLNFVNNFAELSLDLAAELMEELASDPTLAGSDAVPEVTALIIDLKENSRRIHEHSQRADKIVHAMLRHSRGGASERSTVDINAFVEEYANLAFHGQRARDHEVNIDMKLDLDPNAGEVELVPQEIGRVLINLIANAFYAVQEASKVRGRDFSPMVALTTKRKSRTVEIKISDNGPGIAESMRHKIFEPFYTTKSSGEGTGLGLSLSYEIVTQSHNGAIHVQSNLGQGSTFTVELPS